MNKCVKTVSIILLCIAACCFANSFESYAAKPIPDGYTGGDGKSIESAVSIPYIGDYEKSIDREYDYISSIFGVRDVDWAFMEQVLLEKNEKFYDKVTIKITYSKEIFSVYFDITEPYTVLHRQLRQ